MNTLPTSIPAGPRYAAQPTATAAYVPPAAAMPVAPVPVASAPVEVAYAPPSGDAAFDPPPGWTPGSAQQSATASYGRSPVSSAPPPAPIEPVRVAAADPAPPPFAANLPMPTPPAPIASVDVTPPAYVAPAYAASSYAAPVYAAQAPRAEPVYPRTSPTRSAVAALPEPPPFVPSVQTAAAYAPPGTLQHQQAGYRLIPTAMAAPAPVYRGGSGQWAIQVGAFGNEGLAHIAVGNAREQAAGALAAAKPAVATVREPHGTLYRARLVGLSRDAASEACERLSRARTSCIVLSPEAQN